MSASTAVETSLCFQFKASFSPCTILQLKKYDLTQLEQQIQQTIARAPNIFLGSPVIIDLEKIHSIPKIDFAQLKNILIKVGLVPMGVRGCSGEQEIQALAASLPLANVGKKATSLQMHSHSDISEYALSEESPGLSDLSVKSAFESGDSDGFSRNKKCSQAEVMLDRPVQYEDKINRPHHTKIVTTPIRSGMQVYAKDGDLIVVGQVSSGAELLSDGHIHVYGPLRGRALAGLLGNTQTRIFCRTLEAELVSIAGFYLTKEDMQVLPAHNGMIQIYLENEQVKIEAL